MIELRPYQQRGVDEIRSHFKAGVSHVCFQLPTGGGKTIVFSYIVAAAVAKGSRVLVLAHRVEILEQIAGALTKFGVRYGIIAAGYDADPDAPVQVASIFTLALRLSQIGQYDLVVIDECHHAAASTWRRILVALPRAFVLGVSATPVRLDGKGLDDLFGVLVTGPTVRELIDQGHLAPFVGYGPQVGPDLKGVRVQQGDYQLGQLAEVMSDGIVIKAAVREYERICPGAASVAFGVDISHSRKVAQAFCDAGWRSAHVDGETPRDERKGLIAALARGELDILSNCGLISEGLDVPGVEAAILLRPTMSRALYLQQVGRALRPGKPKAFILDHAGCVARHGLPDHPHAWTLAGKPKGEAADDDATARQCEECGAFNAPDATYCAECGAALIGWAPPEDGERQARGERDSVLGEIETPDFSWIAAAPHDEVVGWAGRDWSRLALVARLRGYKSGWIWHRMKEPKHAE